MTKPFMNAIHKAVQVEISKKSMNFNELKKYIDYDKLARVVEVNYFDSDHKVSTKWKFESIKLS